MEEREREEMRGREQEGKKKDREARDRGRRKGRIAIRGESTRGRGEEGGVGQWDKE